MLLFLVSYSLLLLQLICQRHVGHALSNKRSSFNCVTSIAMAAAQAMQQMK